MAAERSVALSLTVKNYQAARQQLLSLGADGQQALARIEQGGAAAGRGLRVVDGVIPC